MWLLCDLLQLSSEPIAIKMAIEKARMKDSHSLIQDCHRDFENVEDSDGDEKYVTILRNYRIDRLINE